MAVTDEIKRLKLGESLEKIVKNADDNFVSLFDSVADLDESIKNVVQTSEAMIFKGTLGTGGTVTSLPTTHSAGDTYKVVTAGIYAGKNCNVGDLIICVKDSDDTSNIDTHWTVFEGNPDGSVTSSSTSSTDGHIAVFDGSSGKIVKDSGFTIKTSVPENAKFTDTTYDVATTTKDGLMSATDKSNLNQNTTARHSHSNKSVLDATTASYTTAEKTKLGKIEEGANKYILPNAGTTLGGVKSGGDVTIKDGVITVDSVGGKNADEIGKVKDVTVNGASVLNETTGVAAITIESLKSGYVSVSDSSLVDCTVDGTTYKAIKVVDTDTALEVYSSSGNKILTHTVRKDGYLYICVGTTAIACTLRKVGGNSVGVGGGGVDFPIGTVFSTTIENGYPSVGTWVLIKTDILKESGSKTISGTTTTVPEGAMNYRYKKNESIGTGWVDVTIEPTSDNAYKATVNYNKTTGVAECAVWSNSNGVTVTALLTYSANSYIYNRIE